MHAAHAMQCIKSPNRAQSLPAEHALGWPAPPGIAQHPAPWGWQAYLHPGAQRAGAGEVAHVDALPAGRKQRAQRVGLLDRRPPHRLQQGERESLAQASPGPTAALRWTLHLPLCRSTGCAAALPTNSQSAAPCPTLTMSTMWRSRAMRLSCAEMLSSIAPGEFCCKKAPCGHKRWRGRSGAGPRHSCKAARLQDPMLTSPWPTHAQPFFCS